MVKGLSRLLNDDSSGNCKRCKPGLTGELPGLPGCVSETLSGGEDFGPTDLMNQS